MASKHATKRQGKNLDKDEISLTDVDTDSDIKEQQVRLPRGLPAEVQLPQLPPATDSEVEQECQRHLDNRYILIAVFPWLSQQLNSEILRASALSRRGLPSKVFTSRHQWLSNQYLEIPVGISIIGTHFPGMHAHNIYNYLPNYCATSA